MNASSDPVAARPIMSASMGSGRADALPALPYERGDAEIRGIVRASCLFSAAVGVALTVRNGLDLLNLREFGFRVGPGFRGVLGTLIAMASLAAAPALAATGWRAKLVMSQSSCTWLVRSLAVVALSELAAMAMQFVRFPRDLFASSFQLRNTLRGILINLISLGLPAFLMYLFTRSRIRREFEPR